jgi:alanyl-tRNA synthetase
MPAERLYYDASALEERALDFSAQVTDIRLDSKDETGQLWQVALDRTAFYPTGGGQPHDLGTLTATSRSGAVLEVAVERVEEDDAGEVWHYVRKPLIQGTKIAGQVDAERRLDHAQQHSGQHLLSAVFLRELNARTVSFHLSPLRTGADSVTIDLALSEGAPKLTDDDLARIELATNRVVAEDRAITPRWVSHEEAEAMLARGDLRKLPERVGPMRIVTMEGIEHNACGGTHVASTGAIGSVLVRRLEKVKQGQRVEFVCGLRAVRTARRDFELLRQTGALLSVGAADVPDRITRLLEDRKAAAKEIKALLKQQAGLAQPPPS